MRYSRSENTISVSTNTFSTTESGELLYLICNVRADSIATEASSLTLLTPILNGAIVPGTDCHLMPIPTYW